MALEDLITPGSNTLAGGSGATWLDADTIQDPKLGRVRIKGIDAPETFKSAAGLGGTQEVGAAMTTEQVRDLANKLGYTEVISDGTPDATGTRVEGDLRNPKTGRLFSQELAKSGVVGIHHDYDPGGQLQQSKEYADFAKSYEGTEWEQARFAIEEAVDREQKYANQFKTAQDYSGQIGQLERMLAESDDPAEKAMIRQRIKSISEFATADIQLTDRDQVSGAALNPWSDSWDVAMLGVQEALYGVANMGGETFGSEAVADWGESGVRRAQSRIGDHAWAVRDWKDVAERDHNGDIIWDNTFGNAVDYVANNAIMSLPYMGISIAGAAFAPVTGGLSMTAPAAVYAGQTWNEMEGDKNAAVAIGSGVAQAVLDRVGLSFITKGLTANQVLKKATKELMAGGMTKEMAEQTVLKASRIELAHLAGDAMKVAKAQLAGKQVFKNFAARAATGAGGEAITEAMQEATAYTGATMGSDKAFDWHELQERMIAGAIAGGALGGTFGQVGAAADTAAWADVAWRVAPADAKLKSQSQKYAEEEIARNGRVSSIQEETMKARAKAEAQGPNAADAFQDRVDRHKHSREQMSTSDKIVDAALSAPSLWRGSVRWIFGPDVQAKSRSARILADMFGGNLQRIFSGSNFESTKHHKVAMYKNMVPIPDKIYNQFAGGRRLTRKVKRDISQRIYRTMQAAIDPETKQFNADLIPDGPEKAAVVALAGRLNALSDKMWSDQKEYNPDLGFQHNYLMRYKAFDKEAIHKNQHEFRQALIDKTGMTEAEAKELTDAILDSAEVNDLEEAFSVTKGGIVPGSHQQRTLNLSEDENFQQFMQQDLFANISTAAKSAARYTAHREFIGQNGAVISQLLNDMEAEGIPPKQVDKIAKQLQDYLDAESGNYKRPTSEAGKAAIKLQKHFMMFTTLAGLPLATISSFVEAALTMRGLTMNQITRKEGGLASLGKELAQTLWDGADWATAAAIHKQPRGVGPATHGQRQLQDLGFYEWDVGAATVTGVSETNAWQQQWYETFFKITGLTGWTNYTRAVRASIAGDYITDKVETIAMGDLGSNEVQEATEGLRNLGINVDDMVSLYTKSLTGRMSEADMEKLNSNIREGTFNFINDAVALPSAANRPLIYQDPRFALFTQFQGFIATFTANHIPKLWGEYVKRGSPAMKYNAFALMTTMIMLGFASQHLKDLIKYGGKSPYLDDAEYLQRGIRSSGLLGTSERILDQFFPLYEQRSDDVTSWVFNTTTGESPALSNLKRLGKATGAALEGDTYTAGKNIAKSLPLIGPFNYLTEGRFADDLWNFRGE